jgi:hypothetical protein
VHFTTSLHVFFGVKGFFVISFQFSEPGNQSKECDSAQNLIFSHGVSLSSSQEKKSLLQIPDKTPERLSDSFRLAIRVFSVVFHTFTWSLEAGVRIGCLSRNSTRDSNHRHVTLALPNMGV